MTGTPLKIGWLIVSAGLFLLIGYGVPRDQFNLLITLYGLLFWGYWLRVSPLWRTPKAVSEQPDAFLFSAAVLFRLALLVAMPLLSDDYARFVWDGRLLAHGYNPYLYLPVQIVGTPLAASAGLSQTLFESLNSPAYFTVYPPLNQAFFGLAAWLSPDVWGNVIGLRLPILGAELGSIWLMVRLLRRAGQNPNLALLYALNPLVILELTGNVHFETVMIFFMLLAVWLFVNGQFAGSAGALALAIGTKLLPLLFLPLIIRHLGWKRGIGYAALTGLLTAGLFVPFASIDLARNVFSSLNLYFQLFEFNASLHYLIRAVGFWLVGRNITVDASFWLFLTAVSGILGIAFGVRRTTRPVVAGQVLLTLTFYFALATTVHPWYATTLVAATVFTRFRYPLLWSGLIWLSYATYQTVPYHENMGLTALEYGVVVGVGGYEWYRARTKQKNTVMANT
ncbi:MAG: hypothetical protein H7Z72_22340 [Bacteroidetes bacterium]|nr:hypothetical protein [Fibrella sp.]